MFHGGVFREWSQGLEKWMLLAAQMEFVNFLNWILPIGSFPLDSLNFEALEAFLVMLE